MGSASATSPKRTWSAIGWCGTSSGPTPRMPKADMKRPSWEEVRYHGTRWAWVLVLAVLAYLAFPSSATDLAPLLEPGAKAERDVVAPFDFVVTKTDEELAREAERSEEHTSELQSH